LSDDPQKARFGAPFLICHEHLRHPATHPGLLRARCNACSTGSRSTRPWIAYGSSATWSPRSDSTGRRLRFVRRPGQRRGHRAGQSRPCTCFAIAEGFEKLKRGDTLLEILEGTRSSRTTARLAAPPGVMHRDAGFTLVHAVLLPDMDGAAGTGFWSRRGRSGAPRRRLPRFLSPTCTATSPAARWDDALSGFERLRVIVNAHDQTARVHGGWGDGVSRRKAHPRTLPPPYLPWLCGTGATQRRRSALFGHWSSLGCCTNTTSGVWMAAVCGAALASRRLRLGRPAAVPCLTAMRQGPSPAR